MKNLLLMIFLLVIPLSILAQSADSVAIKEASLDYADGWYSGDPVRMERSINPDLDKAFPERINTSGGITFRYARYSLLVEGACTKLGFTEVSKRKLSVKIINISGDFAKVRINSARFNDYLHRVRVDNQLKIVNIIYFQLKNVYETI